MTTLIGMIKKAASWVLLALFMAILCGTKIASANDAPKSCDLSINIAGEEVLLFATSSGIHASVHSLPHDPPPFCVLCCCPCCCSRCCSTDCSPDEEMQKMQRLIDDLKGKDRHFAEAIISRGLSEAAERGGPEPGADIARRLVPRGTGGGGG